MAAEKDLNLNTLEAAVEYNKQITLDKLDKK
jgi:hypothetical protein